MTPEPTPRLATSDPQSPAPIALARRMAKMPASAVREILKVAERPDVLSFAGGLPAPELFPVGPIAEAFAQTLAREGGAALQYSVTEGYGPLRDWIARRMVGKGVRAERETVLITSGAQQGIDLIARVLIDPGDVVAVEDPSYLAALQVFRGFEAELLPIASDDEGMRVDDLEQKLRHTRPKMIYLVSNFHNPKGTTLVAERRRMLARLAAKHRIPVVEDDPYGELRYRGEAPPPIAAFDDGAGVVVYLSTFSKTLAPGLRLGWMVAPPALARQVTVAKQATDLHSGTLAQRAAATLLETFDYDGHLAGLRRAYGARCDAMLDALERHLPAGTTWTRPEGGMFLWVRLPEGLTGEGLFDDALNEKVAFVPGSSFFAGTPDPRFVRLNFSNRTPELIDEGMRRLGRVIAARMDAGPTRG